MWLRVAVLITHLHFTGPQGDESRARIASGPTIARVGYARRVRIARARPVQEEGPGFTDFWGGGVPQSGDFETRQYLQTSGSGCTYTPQSPQAAAYARTNRGQPTKEPLMRTLKRISHGSPRRLNEHSPVTTASSSPTDASVN